MHAAIRRNVAPHLNCTWSVMDTVLGTNDFKYLPKCATSAEMVANAGRVGIAVVEFSVSAEKSGCPLPCAVTKYELRLEVGSEAKDPKWTNSSMSIPYGSSVKFTPWAFSDVAPEVARDYDQIYLGYTDLTIKREFERLLYSFPDLLSAMGGSIGLMLGFSCYSILVEIIDHARNLMGRIK